MTRKIDSPQQNKSQSEECGRVLGVGSAGGVLVSKQEWFEREQKQLRKIIKRKSIEKRVLLNSRVIMSQLGSKVVGKT